MEQNEILNNHPIVEMLTHFNKLNERLDGLGKLMVNNQTKNDKLITDSQVKLAAALSDVQCTLYDKIEEKCKKSVYQLQPSQSEHIGELADALAKASLEFKIPTKSGKSNRGHYATIDDLKEATIPALSKNGLAVKFGIPGNEYGEFMMSVTLVHKSDQWMRDIAPLKENVANNGQLHQQVGAAEKYLRRYMYRAMLNLGEDDE